jgi:hypothetical protein
LTIRRPYGFLREERKFLDEEERDVGKGHVGHAQRWLACAMVGLAVWTTAGTSAAGAPARIEGVDFNDRVTSSGVEFKLNSIGLLRIGIFIKAYAAGLYLGPGADAEDILADTPKRLEISYFWSISAETFMSSTREAIERNSDPATLERIARDVDRFLALYQSVQPGDRYALTYVPGVGTELALNGKPLGRVAGADFGAAVFSVWFGDKGIDGALKKSLLGD